MNNQELGQHLDEAVFQIPFAMENILKHMATDWDAAFAERNGLPAKLFDEIVACVGVLNALGYIVGVNEENGDMTYMRARGANVVPVERLEEKRRLRQ